MTYFTILDNSLYYCLRCSYYCKFRNITSFFKVVEVYIKGRQSPSISSYFVYKITKFARTNNGKGWLQLSIESVSPWFYVSENKGIFYIFLPLLMAKINQTYQNRLCTDTQPNSLCKKIFKLNVYSLICNNLNTV